jgi:hypothetical protein
MFSLLFNSVYAITKLSTTEGEFVIQIRQFYTLKQTFNVSVACV